MSSISDLAFVVLVVLAAVIYMQGRARERWRDRGGKTRGESEREAE